MKIKLLSVVIILLLYVGITQAQDCPQVDCPGRCGRFTDKNGDGFCDFGNLSKPEAKQDTVSNTINIGQPTPKSDNKIEQRDTNSSLLNENSSVDTTATNQTAKTAAKCDNKYPFFPIFIATFITFIISVALVKTNVWTKATHRKIWNILLCITFLVSGLLGLLLAIFINYQYYPEKYIFYLHLHVEFGIAMAIISIFHILWHLTYFKNIFKKSKAVATTK